jgi:hypothetical protein
MDLEHLLQWRAPDKPVPNPTTLGHQNPLVSLIPGQGLDSETHVGLENKQQQQQRICKRLFEATSFSFLCSRGVSMSQFLLAVANCLGCQRWIGVNLVTLVAVQTIRTHASCICLQPNASPRADLAKNDSVHSSCICFGLTTSHRVCTTHSVFQSAGNNLST